MWSCLDTGPEPASRGEMKAGLTQWVGWELKRLPLFCRQHPVHHSRLVPDPGHHIYRRSNEKKKKKKQSIGEKRRQNIPFLVSIARNSLDYALNPFAFDTLLVLVVFEDNL